MSCISSMVQDPLSINDEIDESRSNAKNAFTSYIFHCNCDFQHQSRTRIVWIPLGREMQF